MLRLQYLEIWGWSSHSLKHDPTLEELERSEAGSWMEKNMISEEPAAHLTLMSRVLVDYIDNYCWWRITCNSFLLNEGSSCLACCRLPNGIYLPHMQTTLRSVDPNPATVWLIWIELAVFWWCQMVYHPLTVIIPQDFVHQAVLKVPKTII